MNGFSYVCNRWIFGYSFFIAYLITLKWKNLFSLAGKEKTILLFSLNVCLILCVAFKESGSGNVLFGVAVGFFILALLFLVKDILGIEIAQKFLLFVILFNITGNAFFFYSSQYYREARHSLKYKDIPKMFQNNEAEAIKFASARNEDFFRYSGATITYDKYNSTLLSGLHSTQYFWSLENGDIAKYMNEMGLCDTNISYLYRGLDSRTFLSTLANVRYYVQNDNTPFGFIPMHLDNKYSSYKVWQNKFSLPFGYTYFGWLPRKEYESMTPLQKQEALLQGCVVDNVDNNESQQTKAIFTGEKLQYEIKSSNDITVENKIITVKKNNAAMTLTFDGMNDAETYLYVTGFDFLGNMPVAKQQQYLRTYAANKFYFYKKYYQGAYDVNLQLTARDNTGKYIMTTLPYRTPRHNWYCNREDFMVNLGYDQKAKKSITIKFPLAGQYIFDSMQILCQPMANYPQQIEKLKKDVLTNVDFHDKNAAFATNKVTGQINLAEPKYLLLTIPYSTGWTASVDGKEQELLKANTMFMALYLGAGKHDIVLHYCTPGLKTGAVISLLSLLLALMLIYRESKRGKQAC